MLCHVCNTENRSERKFCGKCGQQLLSPCAECGFKNYLDEAFCGGCGKALDKNPGSASIDHEAGLPGSSDSAERRQLTVMFCDLADSTLMSARLDPEDLNRLNRDYQDVCTRVIKQFSGFVARYMGDGILSYFGYPVAHENDAENAILAALELHRQVSKLNVDDYHGERLSVRIGIATGSVVVGDVIGEGASKESTAVGQTPNLAARLQGISPIGEVVIADRTYQLAGALFEYKDLGLITIKGIPTPIRHWQVVGQKATESRFAALSGSELTPMVGRHHELNLARPCWIEASSGSGQMLMLSGEPGIGKSRLVQNIDCLSTSQESRVIQCSPHHRSSALYPVSEYLNRHLGKNNDRSLAGLRQLLAKRELTEEENVELLSELLFIDPSAPESPQQTAQQRKLSLLRLLPPLLTGSECEEPVLLVFEDLHWVDPTTKELLDVLVPYIVDKQVLMLVTYRPEYKQDWTGQAHVHLLSLNRINTAQCREMISSIAGDRISTTLAQKIIERTDGIPLFVEEMTKTVMGSGQELDDSAVDIDVPASLADSLNTRLDRLGSARSVARAGSVIGRDFDRELLKVITRQSDTDLDANIESLLESGLVFQFGSGKGLHFQFKHALIQDIAYNSLLREQRKLYHQRVAVFLEQQRPDVVAAQPDLIAQHFGDAGLFEKSLEYRCKAGRQALSRSAISEALSHFTSALESIESPEANATEQLELEALIGLGSCYRFNDRYQDALAALDRAEALALKLDRAGELSDICNTRGNIYFPLGNQEECLREHQHSLEHARRQGSLEKEIRAIGGLGDAYYNRGEMKKATLHFSKCCDLAAENGYVYQHAANRAMIGWSRIYELEFPQALQDALLAIDLCIQCGHYRSRMNAEALACFVRGEMMDFDAANRHGEHSREMARKVGANNFITALEYFNKQIPTDSAEQSDKLRKLREAAATSRKLGHSFHGPSILVGLLFFIDDSDERAKIIAEAESILQKGCVGHNYYWFYQQAMEASLRFREWDNLDKFIRALGEYDKNENSRWVDFYSSRALVLKAVIQGNVDDNIRAEMLRLIEIGQRHKLKGSTQLLIEARNSFT